MNTALEIEKNRTKGGLEEQLTFVGLPSKTSARELSGSQKDLFKQIVTILNDLLLHVIDKETRAEFIAAREVAYGDIQKTSRAMSKLAQVVLPHKTIERLSWEAFAELEADLMQQGLKRFGAAARDQAIFTIWAFRRITRLQSKIQELGTLTSPDLLAKDLELANDFAVFSGWAQFHFECLVASMRFNKPLQPEVLEEICDGLRAAVNAYGLIRQGVDLRSPSEAVQDECPYEWDEEDQELLDSSMIDLREMQPEGL